MGNNKNNFGIYHNKSSPYPFLFYLLLILFFLFILSNCNLIYLLFTLLLEEQFLATSLTVSNWTVSQVTTLNYQLFLNTQTIASGDYLLIILPNTLFFSTTSTPTCSSSPVTVSSCTISSSSTAKITYSASSTYSSFQGAISNFQNPDSVISVTTISLQLYSSAGVLKASSASSSLNGFTPSTLTASLSSSSNVVGYSGAILSVSITPATKLKASGIITITVPQYYTNAGGNYMINSVAPTCAATGVTISSCYFVQSTRQVNIVYSFTSGSDVTTLTTFTISSLNNPISTQTMTGFSIATQDSSGNSIASVSGLSLSGISVPTSFAASQISITGTSSIGQYTSIQITLSFSVPVQQNCYLKFIFPTDFTIDNNLASLTGSGLFTASTTSSQVPWISINTQTNTVILEACQIYYGLSQAGQITFSQIKNPGYVKSTGTVQIYLAQDSAFQYMISQLTSGLAISSSQFQPGSISDISVTAVDNQQVQTSTSFQFTFTPFHDMTPVGASILFQYPTLITLGSSCQVYSKSATFDSSTIACAVQGQIMTITSPFTKQYSGGTELIIQIGNGNNPVSVRDAGTFTITTYINVAGTLYIVDQGTASNQIIPTGGWIHKGIDILVSSPVTYNSPVSYQFSLLFQHLIPQGGYIRIIIPSSVSISDFSKVKSGCFRVDTKVQMTCSAVSSSEIDVTLDSTAFPSGYPASTQLQFSINGFQNPRTTQTSDLFYFYATDSSEYAIDQSSSNDYFTVTMTTMGLITSISVNMDDKVNGDQANYLVSISPNTPIIAMDEFTIQFPQEVTLPLTGAIQCTASTTNIVTIQCNLMTTTMMQVIFQKVNSINPGDSVTFQVPNVKNPSTTQPSSMFSNMVMTTSTGYSISQYLQNNIYVQTLTAANITMYSLSQSNGFPQQNAIYTIQFKTANSLPNTAAIQVITPASITLNTTDGTCYIEYTQVMTSVCTIQENLILIKNAFIQNSLAFFGNINIVFQALNPQDGTNNQSIIVRTYTDSSYQYKIDKLESGLFPQLSCNYPCKMCIPTNPNFCTDCFQNDMTRPAFLQMLKNGSQTCQFSCNSGYTSNGSQNPKTCVSCDPQCLTCSDNFTVGDYKKCQSCPTSYPFYYNQTQYCYQQCFTGTYTSGRSQCIDCSQPCQTCLNATSCLTCYQLSALNILNGDKCVNSCPFGKIAINQQCVPCQSPCATCEAGLVNSCLSCDQKSDNQFLFGRECVAKCPNGTTLNLTSLKCEGCRDGCNTCLSENNAVCLSCTNNLALFNNTCLVSCPQEYLKSKDGRTCELRPYLLDGSLIYFPFAGAAGLVIIICITSFFTTGHKSLILSNSIALLSIIEVASIAFIFYQSYLKDYLLIYLCSLGILALLVLLNTCFFIFYCFRLQFSDLSFNYWRQRSYFIVIFILFLSTTINFKIFRLLYSRLFGLQLFSAKIDNHHSFLRAIQVFSFLSFFLFTLPVMLGGAIIIYELYWGTQLYMTVLEACGITFISGVFMIFEYCPCCTCNAYAMLEIRDEQQLNKKKKLAQKLYNMIEEANSQIIDVNEGKQFQKELNINEINEQKKDIRMEKKMRQDVLKNIVNTVKNNKDLNLNKIIDDYMEQEMLNNQNENFQQQQRSQSMKDLFNNKGENIPEEGEDDRKTKSYPSSPKDLNSQDLPPASLWFEQNNLKQTQKQKIKHIKRTIENMQTEFKFDNVFAESRPPPLKLEKSLSLKVQQFDIEIQTESFEDNKKKKNRKRSDSSSLQSSSNTSKSPKRQLKSTIDDRQAQESLDQYDEEKGSGGMNRKNQNKKKKVARRGKKNNEFYTQIDEEDEDENFSGQEDQQNYSKTINDGAGSNNKYLGVIVEDDGEIVNIKEDENYKKKLQEQLEMDERNRFLEQQHIEGKNRVIEGKIPKQEYFNQRTFNINDILGNFERNANGRIINRKQVVQSNLYKDKENKTVNQKGYLLDTYGSDIINKYSFNVMFRSEHLTNDNDIPIVNRIESYNFNPHEIFGHFEYAESSDKPIILKNKMGQLVDKNLRYVNQSGFLVDNYGNIIDNSGRIKFIKEQLNQRGDIPKLYNLKGRQYNIREIIGTFRKDSATKEIIFGRKTPANSKILVDCQNRQVNQKGYLIDAIGNIINKQGKVVFRKYTLQFNEPPKLFPFTEFDISWVLGSLDYNAYGRPIIEFSPYHGGLRDQLGRQINERGYLVDSEGNVVDSSGKIVFYKEILEKGDTITEFNSNRFSELPKVFRMGIFKQYNDDEQIINDNDQLAQQQLESEQNNVNNGIEIKQIIQNVNNNQNISRSEIQNKSLGVVGGNNNPFQIKSSISSNQQNRSILSDTSQQQLKQVQQNEINNMNKQISVNKIMPFIQVDSFKNEKREIAIKSEENKNQELQQQKQNLNNKLQDDIEKQDGEVGKKSIINLQQTVKENAENNQKIGENEDMIQGQNQDLEEQKKIQKQLNKKRLKTAKQQKTKSPFGLQKPPKQKDKIQPQKKLKKTTTPFDYKTASHPHAFISQNKSKERLSKLTNSITNLNQTTILKQNNSELQMKKQVLSKFGSTEEMGKHNLKNIIKNPYLLSNEQISSNNNSGDQDTNLAYNRYLNQDNSSQSQINNQQQQKYNNNNKYKSKRLMQNESGLDQQFYLNNNEDNTDENQNYDQSSDEQISDDGGFNNNFNIDKSSYYQYGMKSRKQLSGSSRLDLSSYSADSQSSQHRGGVDRFRKNRIGNKMKQLERIYLNKLEMPPRSASSNSYNKQLSQKKFLNQTSMGNFRQAIPIVQSGYQKQNESYVEDASNYEEMQMQEDNDEEQQQYMGRYNQNAKSQLIFGGNKSQNYNLREYQQ